MPRFPIGPSVKKLKIGTTVVEATAEAIGKVQERKPEVIRTTGEAIDYAFKIVDHIDDRIARLVSEECRRLAAQLDREANSFGLDGSGFSAQEKRSRREGYLELAECMEDFFESDEGVRGMRRIDLQGGDYAVVPSTWPVLNPEDAKYCRWVVVIEITGRGTADAPHFVYLLDHQGHIQDFEKKKALELATAVWPEMARVLENEVPRIYDDNGKVLNEDEHMRAPKVNYFRLLDSSWYTNPWDREPPYGAVIYRSDIAGGAGV